MFFNWIPMLVPISHNIKFGMVEALKDHKSPTILKAPKGVVQTYKTAGFIVNVALMDGESQHLRV